MKRRLSRLSPQRSHNAQTRCAVNLTAPAKARSRPQDGRAIAHEQSKKRTVIMGKALPFCRVGGSAAVEPKSLDLVGPV